MVTINVIVQKASLPAVFIFLPNRLQPTYERAFSAIFATEQLAGVTPLSVISGKLNLINLTPPPPPANSALTLTAEVIFQTWNLHW